MAEPSIKIEYKRLEAVHDHMSKQLHVFGECEVRGGGFAVAITPLADPEHGGINPDMLTLAISVPPLVNRQVSNPSTFTKCGRTMCRTRRSTFESRVPSLLRNHPR